MTIRVLMLVTEDWYFRSHRLDLARALRVEGVEVVVGTRINHERRQLSDEGLEIYPLPFERSLSRPWRDLATVREITRLVARVKPDLVHLVALKPALLGGLALRRRRSLPVLTAFAGLGYLFTSGDRRARLLRPLLTVLLRPGLALNRRWSLVQNEDDRALLSRLKLGADERRVVIAGSGIDINQFCLSPRPCDEPGAIETRVLFAARLLRDKGIYELLDAAERLSHSHSNIRIVVVGACDPDNPASVDEAQVRAWHDSGLIEWLGHRKDMAQVYADCDIVCLPSYREGLPKALLEGAACGRPLIASDVPGCREVCIDGVTGRLVAARNSSALALAIEQLAGAPDEARQLGINAAAHIEQHYTVPHIARQTAALYRRMLHSTRPLEADIDE